MLVDRLVAAAKPRNRWSEGVGSVWLLSSVNRGRREELGGRAESSGQSFEISKWEVQEAWRGQGEQGCTGVDGCSIEEVERIWKHLYRIWNRMSWEFFPPPVRAVEIPNRRRHEGLGRADRGGSGRSNGGR